MKQTCFLLTIGIVLSWAPVAMGQNCTVLKGAILHLPTGPVSDGSALMVEDGRLKVLGKSDPIPGHCAVRHVEGKVITAGLVEPTSRLGLVEVELEPSTVDSDPGEAWGDRGPVRASFRVWEGVNPRSASIPVTRVEGITSTVVVPSGGVVSGQGAWLDLVVGTQEDAVRRKSAAMVVRLGGSSSGSRALALHRFTRALEMAREFQGMEKAWKRGASPEFGIPVEELRALYPVLQKEIPVMFHADRASDLESICRLVKKENLRGIVVGAAEGWLVAEQLAAARISVILDPLLYTGRNFDQLQGRKDNGKLLLESGVPVMLSSFETHNARTLRQVAGNAVRGGMSPLDALKAITSVPAKAFGMKSYGELADGGMANFVVWDGDPFECSTLAEQVWIHGDSVSLETRQTLLRDKYIRHLGLIR